MKSNKHIINTAQDYRDAMVQQIKEQYISNDPESKENKYWLQACQNLEMQKERKHASLEEEDLLSDIAPILDVSFQRSNPTIETDAIIYNLRLPIFSPINSIYATLTVWKPIHTYPEMNSASHFRKKKVVVEVL
ncbi:hypothetical protein [Dokdonia sp.]|uniref:hypothetical protein n=1 Tax=Dokdonia sp. TaxID=2024995 RepID=UPI003263B8A8